MQNSAKTESHIIISNSIVWYSCVRLQISILFLFKKLSENGFENYFQLIQEAQQVLRNQTSINSKIWVKKGYYVVVGWARVLFYSLLMH